MGCIFHLPNMYLRRQYPLQWELYCCRMLIGILIIGIFVVLVYYLDPERKLTKRQKVGVVK